MHYVDARRWLGTHNKILRVAIPFPLPFRVAASTSKPFGGGCTTSDRGALGVVWPPYGFAVVVSHSQNTTCFSFFFFFNASYFWKKEKKIKGILIILV